MSKTRFSHAAAFGAAGSIAVIALALIIYLAGLKNSALNWLSYPIIITVAVIGVKKWREQNGGFLTYGQTYMHLFLQCLVYSIIMTIWTFVFVAYVAPGLIEDQMLLQQAKMEDEGKMTAEQIEMAMHYARMFTTPAMMTIFAFLGNIIMLGLIYLIVAAIMKKDPPVENFFGGPMNQSHPNAPYGGTPNQQYENLGNQQQPPTNFPPQQ